MDEQNFLQEQPVAQATGKTFGIRAGAYIIDTIIYLAIDYAILYGVGFLVALALFLIGSEVTFGEGSSRLVNFLVGLIQSVIYFAIFEWLYGATPGKLLLGMRVVKETGEPCDLKAALIRGLFRFIDGLFLGIPAYFSMRQPLYQRMGDKPARTLVVGARDAFIRRPRAWWWFLIALAAYLAINITIALLVLIDAMR